jgi:hypothetical protein
MPGLPLTLAVFTTIEHPGLFWLAIVLSAVVFGLLMFGLHLLPSQAKKYMMIGGTFIAGLYFALEFFWPRHKVASGEMENFITPTIQPVSDFIFIVFGWTVGLGLISLVLVHGKRLVKGRDGWYNSLAFFLALLAIVITGFWTQMGGAAIPHGQEWGGLARATTLYTSLYNGLLLNLDAAMFSLLAFYIASAAYRAFRVRTVEAALLMIAAFVVMLGFVEFGVMLTSWIDPHSFWAFFRLEKLASWILNNLNMPAYRAVGLGVAVGSLAMAMRLWLSLERGVFFSQE